MSIHKGKYLAVATFTNVDTIKAPKNYIKDQGWTVNSKNLAQELKYRLDIFELPKYYQSEENQRGKQTWKELNQLNMNKSIQSYDHFQTDEIISSISSLNLEVQRNEGQEVQQREDFLFVQTIKLDTKLEKAWYQSCMYIF